MARFLNQSQTYVLVVALFFWGAVIAGPVYILGWSTPFTALGDWFFGLINALYGAITALEVLALGRSRGGDLPNVPVLTEVPKHRFLWYLSGEKLRISIVLFAIMMGTAMALAGPWIWGLLLIDRVITGADVGFLPVVLGLLAVTYIGSNLFSYVESYWAEVISQRIIYRLRTQLFVHLESMSLRFYDDRHTGELISRVTNDVNVLESSISSTIQDLVPDVVTLAIGVGILFYLDAWVTSIVVLTFPPVFLVAYLYRARIRKASREAQERLGKVASKVHETIAGMQIVQSFTREEDEAEEFREAAGDTLKATLVSQKLSSSYSSVIGLIAASGSLIAAYLFVPQIVGGTRTLGELTAYVYYVTMMRSPLTGIAKFHYLLEKGRGAADRIFEVLDSPQVVKDVFEASELPVVKGAVQFKGVDFGYRDEPVLKNLNLDVEPGQKVALVGPSGVGKSTVVNLLLRFYDPWRGSISVDGHDIRSVKLRSLRKQIGYVPQDCFLFGGTVRENIAYGDPEATQWGILEAAKAANAHDFIMKLPRGYDTPVGERGVKLSLGQRQRIAIARALVKNPRILVLDEATSNLDSVSESTIQGTLDTAFQGRTVFIIAHRLSTVMNADQILVIWNGGVAEVGTHKELVAKKGVYAELFQTQRSALLEERPRTG